MAKKITFKELERNLNNETFREQFSDDYIMDINTNDAKKILGEHNGPNRKINQNSLKRLMHNLKNGLWDNEIPDSISFDKQGRLADGQHRLTALSKMTDPAIYIRVRVAFGVNRSIYTNTGVSRTADANIRISGLLKPEDEQYFESKIVSALNLLCRYYHNVGVDSVSAKFDYLTNVVNHHFDIIKGFQTPFNPCSVKNASNAAVLSALLNMYALKEINNSDIECICRILKDGYMESPKDFPIVCLRNKIVETAMDAAGMRNMIFRYTHICVQSWKKGKTTKPRLVSDMPNCFDFANTARSIRVIVKERKIV